MSAYVLLQNPDLFGSLFFVRSRTLANLMNVEHLRNLDSHFIDFFKLHKICALPTSAPLQTREFSKNTFQIQIDNIREISSK